MPTYIFLFLLASYGDNVCLPSGSSPGEVDSYTLEGMLPVRLMITQSISFILASVFSVIKVQYIRYTKPLSSKPILLLATVVPPLQGFIFFYYYPSQRLTDCASQ